MKTVVEYLYRAAQAYPEKTAIADEARRISWREFWRMAQRIGRAIQERGILGKPVGVVALRSAYTPVLFMGVACSGNFYVPIDPQLPREKLCKIVKDSGMELILAQEKQLLPLEGVLAEEGYLDLPCLLEGQEEGREPSFTGGRSLEDPLYMVYTSGSTGMPKGVLKTHAAVVDFAEAYAETFAFGSDEVIGNQTPFFFDASAKDLYLLLKTGATLEILPTELFSFPVKLIEYMNERRVTFISWVPSALSIVTQLNAFAEVKPTTLKRVFFVGEVFPMKQLNRWRAALPELTYVNLYGSTEIAGICCYYQVPREAVFAETDVLPIGKPLKNCRVLLVSGGQAVRESGQKGELYLSSEALAKEYFGDVEKTAASFLQLDLDGSGPRRYFKTGDMAHLDEQGNLVFETRRDFQIKHMGHRIELGEIEAAALSLEEIQRCGCVYDEDKRRIVLFCQLSEGAALDGREIQRLLRERLSSYMLPNRVTVLERIPLNANGKIDRPALKSLLQGKEKKRGKAF